MKVSISAGVIGALVAANAVLLVAVQRHAHGPDATAEVSAAATSHGETPSAAPSGPGLSAIPTPIGPSISVVALDDRRAWRSVSAGGCAGRTLVQRTRDGGHTWTALAKPPARATVGIGIAADGNLQLNARGKPTCSFGTWELSGTTWSKSTTDSWLPKAAQNVAVVHDGAVQQPCETGRVTDLAVVGDAAYTLCSTGEIRRVTSNGSAQPVVRTTGAVSIGTADDKTLIVARRTDGCHGLALEKVVGGSAQHLTCVQGVSAPADLTFAGERGWLVGAQGTWTGGVSGSWSKS